MNLNLKFPLNFYKKLIFIKIKNLIFAIITSDKMLSTMYNEHMWIFSQYSFVYNPYINFVSICMCKIYMQRNWKSSKIATLNINDFFLKNLKALILIFQKTFLISQKRKKSPLILIKRLFSKSERKRIRMTRTTMQKKINPRKNLIKNQLKKNLQKIFCLLRMKMNKIIFVT